MVNSTTERWEEEMKSVYQVYVPGAIPGQHDKISITLIFAKEEVPRKEDEPSPKVKSNKTVAHKPSIWL